MIRGNKRRFTLADLLDLKRHFNKYFTGIADDVLKKGNTRVTNRYQTHLFLNNVTQWKLKH